MSMGREDWPDYAEDMYGELDVEASDDDDDEEEWWPSVHAMFNFSSVPISCIPVNVSADQVHLVLWMTCSYVFWTG